MSVTCVLVPVPHAEAEALLRDDDVAWSALVARAARLRPRVARIDAIREELHAALFDRWAGARPPSLFDRARTFLRQRPPPSLDDSGYDPFVHLFGRSLPVVARSTLALAERLAALEAASDPDFDAALQSDLASLSPRAGAVFAASKQPELDVGPRLASLRVRVREAIASESPLAPAWHGVVRALAVSRPVWRFDGEQLPDLLRTLGVSIEVGDASSILRDAGLPESRSTALPKALGDFVGAGGFLSSGLASTLAGSLRLNRRALAENLRGSGDAEAIAVRHVRLLEEALATCQREGAGLTEAAGVEWHDAWDT